MERVKVQEYFRLLEKLFSGYKQQLSGQKVAVLVSGGIDSSIIASFVVRHFPQAILLSLRSEKSVDDDFVAILGKHLGVNPYLVSVSRENLVAVNAEIIELLQQAGVTANPMQVALASVYYFLFQEAHKLGIQTVFTGQGPDILLAGYGKYKGLTGTALKAQIVRDMPLLETDKLRDNAMAKRWQIGTINPYLSEQFVEFALGIPADLLIKNDVEKYLSRRLGSRIHLPRAIYTRPKHAMQYSTGVQKLIK